MVTTAKLSMARTVIDFAPELSRHSIAQPYDTDLRRDLHRRRPHGHATILSTPAAIVVRPGVADTASGDVVISHRETKRCRRDEVGDTGGGRARGKSWWKPRAALIRKARRQRDRNAIVAEPRPLHFRPCRIRIRRPRATGAHHYASGETRVEKREWRNQSRRTPPPSWSEARGCGHSHLAITRTARRRTATS
jgi:hypothetical protein